MFGSDCQLMTSMSRACKIGKCTMSLVEKGKVMKSSSKQGSGGVVLMLKKGSGS